MDTEWSVYVLVSPSSGATYVGVTTDLERRLAQHNGDVPGGARRTRRCGDPPPPPKSPAGPPSVATATADGAGGGPAAGVPVDEAARPDDGDACCPGRCAVGRDEREAPPPYHNEQMLLP